MSERLIFRGWRVRVSMSTLRDIQRQTGVQKWMRNFHWRHLRSCVSTQFIQRRKMHNIMPNRIRHVVPSRIPVQCHVRSPARLVVQSPRRCLRLCQEKPVRSRSGMYRVQGRSVFRLWARLVFRYGELRTRVRVWLLRCAESMCRERERISRRRREYMRVYAHRVCVGLFQRPSLLVGKVWWKQHKLRWKKPWVWRPD